METTRFSGTTASVLLDAVRGIAAVLVLLEHWRNAFFIELADISLHRGVLRPLYLLCSAGEQAVVVFFVLSGYLISGSVFHPIWASFCITRRRYIQVHATTISLRM